MPSPGADHDHDRWLRDLVGRCTFPPPGTELVCAVSGGADSTALLALAVAARCRVAVVHVDHQLRPDSRRDADLVIANAARWDVPVEVVTVTVGAGPNLEARARTARRKAMPVDAATGHTADDQAETVILNLLRGAATGGLSAMRPGLRHPLLALRRLDTVEVCRRLGLAYVDDPTNADPAFVRNRIRHDLLPALGAAVDRDLVPILSRQADVMRDDHDLLDSLAEAIDPTDARAVAAAPVPLARRALRGWLTVSTGDGHHPPNLATVERVLAVARGDAVACDIGNGRRVTRTRQLLSIEDDSGNLV